MLLAVNQTAIAETALVLVCAKTICRGKDAPVEAALRVKDQVRKGMQAVNNLQNIQTFA